MVFAVDQSFATSNRFSVLNVRPTLQDNDSIIVMGSQNLRDGEFSVGSSLQFLLHPVELTTAGVRITGVVDQLIVQNFMASYAINDVWQMEADLPVGYYNSFRPPVIPVVANDVKMAFGDLLVRSRFTLVRSDEHAFGVALIPYVTLPTGNENIFLGERRASGGFIVAGDAQLGKRVALFVNAGFQAREQVLVSDYDVQNTVYFSTGLDVTIAKNLEVKLDTYASSRMGSPFTAKVFTSSEALASMDYRFGDSNFKGVLGGGVALVRGAGVPLCRTFLGISYSPRQADSRRGSLIE